MVVLECGTQALAQTPCGGEGCLTIQASVSKKEQAGYLRGGPVGSGEEVLVWLFSIWPDWARPDSPALGPALLPVLSKISQWDPPSPTPLRIGGAGTWSLAELSTEWVLSPWVPGPTLSATSWDWEGDREDRREPMLCPCYVPSRGMRTLRFSHPQPHAQRVSSPLQVQAVNRRPRGERDLQELSVTGILTQVCLPGRPGLFPGLPWER